ncbi:MAG: ATP-binding protein [Candidatus Obscuribacterales bacterium]|nr:ATP-binding protein [Candidatus Obscuribacterales bacterium]
MAKTLPSSFLRMRIDRWSQFELLELDMDPRVTMLIGTNGTGKTTLLRVLATRLGSRFPFFSTPYLLGNNRFMRWPNLHLSSPFFHGWDVNGVFHYNQGLITFNDDSRAPLMIPANPNVSYEIVFDKDIKIEGLFFPAHRPIIPTKKSAIRIDYPNSKAAAKAFFERLKNLQRRHPGAFSSPQLISDTIHSLYRGNQRAGRDLLHKYKSLVSSILEPNYEFAGFSFVDEDTLVHINGRRFRISAASGGVASMLDLAFQILLKSFLKKKFVVLLDEPENHLHPELQRQLVPALVEHFENVQFVIATHSPLVASSCSPSSSRIYNFTLNDDGFSEASLSDPSLMGANADEVLHDVFGMPETVPKWAKEQFKKIIQKYLEKDVSTESIRELRKDMAVFGLSELIPDAVEEMFRKKSDD